MGVVARPRRQSRTRTTKSSSEDRPTSLRVGYKSVFERRFAERLSLNGVPFEYERDTIPYTRETSYTPDWVIPREGAPDLYVETKGYLSQEDRTELNAFLLQNPGFPLVLVFESARGPLQPLKKGAKTNMGEWLEARGVDWSVSELKEHWLERGFTPTTRGFPRGVRAPRGKRR